MVNDPTVQVALVAGFASIVVALLGLLAEGMRRNHNALRAVKRDTRGTREQVENSHATNLRDDIDVLIDKVEKVADAAGHLLEGQRQHGRELGHLRKDAQQERQERLAADERIDRHIATVAVTAAQVAEALARRESHLDHNPDHNL